MTDIQNCCKNCKYWMKDEDPYMERTFTNTYQCGKAPMMWDVTEWDYDSDDLSRIYKPEYKDNKKFVQDGSDYIAKLYTKGDFYCNEWEPV